MVEAREQLFPPTGHRPRSWKAGRRRRRIAPGWAREAPELTNTKNTEHHCAHEERGPYPRLVWVNPPPTPSQSGGSNIGFALALPTMGAPVQGEIPTIAENSETAPGIP